MIRPLILFVCALCAAGATTWRVQPEASQISAECESTFHDFTITAELVDGAFRLGDAAAGAITVDATSMDSDNDDRNATMHAEHMRSERYPHIRFVLQDWRDGVAHGTWHMTGIQRPVRIAADIVEADGGHRLRADFTIDIRDFRIPIPQVAIATMQPEVRVHADLAVVQDDDTELPQVQQRTLTGIALPDQFGTRHDLGEEARQRLVLIGPHEERRSAQRWEERMSDHLGDEPPPIRIIDASGIRDDAHERFAERIRTRAPEGLVFLLDWDGSLTEHLGLPDDEITVLRIDGEGRIVDQVGGEATAEHVTAALAMLGIEPDPPLSDVHGKGGSRFGDD